jgi:hypothetical protein
MRCGFLHIPQGTPASRAAVMNARLSVCGPAGLVIPARRAARRTIRAAPCRSSRRPPGARKIGPFPGGHLTTSEHPDLLAAAIRDIADRHGVGTPATANP